MQGGGFVAHDLPLSSIRLLQQFSDPPSRLPQPPPPHDPQAAGQHMPISDSIPVEHVGSALPEDDPPPSTPLEDPGENTHTPFERLHVSSVEVSLSSQSESCWQSMAGKKLAASTTFSLNVRATLLTESPMGFPCQFPSGFEYRCTLTHPSYVKLCC